LSLITDVILTKDFLTFTIIVLHQFHTLISSCIFCFLYRPYLNMCVMYMVLRTKVLNEIVTVAHVFYSPCYIPEYIHIEIAENMLR
jgi:hypothetical protein